MSASDLQDATAIAVAAWIIGPAETALDLPGVQEVNHIQARASFHAYRTLTSDENHLNQRRADYKLAKQLWDSPFWFKPPPAIQRSTAAWGSKGCEAPPREG